MSEETNIPQMRETIERLSQDKAGLEKQVAELASANRVYEAKDAFRAAGYPAANGELFAGLNPSGEITTDAVAEFAAKHNLNPVASSTQESEAGGEESTSGAPDGSTNLAGMSGSGSRAGDGGAGGSETQVLTRQEYQELARLDPAAARQAVASGRVEISRDNPFVRDRIGAQRGTNPYADLASGT